MAVPFDILTAGTISQQLIRLFKSMLARRINSIRSTLNAHNNEITSLRAEMEQLIEETTAMKEILDRCEEIMLRQADKIIQYEQIIPSIQKEINNLKRENEIQKKWIHTLVKNTFPRNISIGGSQTEVVNGQGEENMDFKENEDLQIGMFSDSYFYGNTS